MSSAPTTWSMVFSNDEYIFLVSLLGVPEWAIGVSQSEIIKSRVDKAKFSLELKSYISVMKGAVQVDYAIARLFDAIVSARRSVVLHRSLDSHSHSQSTWFHIGSDLLVAVCEDGPGQVKLVAFQDISALSQWLNSELSLPGVQTAVGKAITLDGQILEQARLQAEMGQDGACQSALQAAGIDLAVAVSLCSCLSSQPASGSLSIINRDQAEPFLEDSLAWLVGEESCWAVLPVSAGEPVGASEGKLRLIPSSTAFIEQRTGILLQEAALAAGYIPAVEG